MRLLTLLLAVGILVTPTTLVAPAEAVEVNLAVLADGPNIPACAFCETYQQGGNWFAIYREACFDEEGCTWCPRSEPCWDTEYQLAGGLGETFCEDYYCGVNRLALASRADSAVVHGDFLTVRAYMAKNPGVIRVSADRRSLEVLN